MPFTMTMPKLSPTMEEGTIVKWHKKVGDHVQPNDLLFEVATDKATVEHTSLDEGWLKKIIVNEGSGAVVNQPVAIFTEKEDESIEGYQPQGEAPKAEPEKVVKEKVAPKKKAEPVKTPISVAAPEPVIKKEETVSNEERILASPLARKLAKEKGLELASVKGTGPNQRVMSRDLVNAELLKGGRRHRERPQAETGSYLVEALSPMRKVISQRLQEAKATIPHFYVEQAIDAQPMTNIREQLAKLDIKISFNDLVVKACALALRDHPVVNSGFNQEDNTIIRFQTVDISVAVTLPQGLITPIIRNADYKEIREISEEVRQLAKLAKEGKLKPEEYQGGSFTVSNLGMYGVTNFQAILNPPQAAILAVSGISDVPVVKNGAVVPGKVMHVTLSADHRVVDGVAAAIFVKTVQKYLENPVALVLIEDSP